MSAAVGKHVHRESHVFWVARCVRWTKRFVLRTRGCPSPPSSVAAERPGARWPCAVSPVKWPAALWAAVWVVMAWSELGVSSVGWA